MPRYYFNIRDHVRDDDAEGVELAGPDVARDEAVKFACDFVRNDSSLVLTGEKFIVDVLDEKRNILAHVEINATPSNGHVDRAVD